MNADFQSIWDWLLENSRARQLSPQADPTPEPVSPTSSHSIDDLTLLALEREAEAACRLRERSH